MRLEPGQQRRRITITAAPRSDRMHLQRKALHERRCRVVEDHNLDRMTELLQSKASLPHTFQRPSAPRIDARHHMEQSHALARASNGDAAPCPPRVRLKTVL